ncbi:MAG: SET domain-containing protein [Candidatus Micrarchaeota archaeon]|nr:SET domain-containing protein [Candidatus Micrarchaeota archaeon]MDE1847582.1 SET domain-containing protein [Candidatus Micrarchaeota archaeon]MDE1864814.1 SET domain-containing protein [Candidatus Micrarchaeota archaeon]
MPKTLQVSPQELKVNTDFYLGKAEHENPAKLQKLMLVYGSARIRNTLGRFSGNDANLIAYVITSLAYHLRNPNECLQICNAMDRYNTGIAVHLASQLCNSLGTEEKPNSVLNLSKVLSSSAVADFIGKLGTEDALRVIDCFVETAYELRSVKRITDLVNALREYDGKVATRMVEEFGIPYFLRCTEKMQRIENFLTSEEASSILNSQLASSSTLLFNTAEMLPKYGMRAVRALKLAADVGIGQFSLLDILQIRLIIDNNLDYLIGDANSARAVLSYALLWGNPPKPERENIEHYSTLLGEYLDEKYGLTTQLNTSQLALFCKIDEWDRKGAAKIISNANESYGAQTIEGLIKEELSEAAKEYNNSLFIKECRHGRGLHANRDFKPNERIFELIGEIRTRASLPHVDTDKTVRYVQIGQRLYVDNSISWKIDYINHSCNPNAGIVVSFAKMGWVSVNLIAIKEIKKGQEVTFDYSTTMNEDKYQLECLCGAQDCRGKIGDFKYLPKERQQYYINMGVVPSYATKIMQMERIA